jgi:hypothetical protein
MELYLEVSLQKCLLLQKMSNHEDHAIFLDYTLRRLAGTLVPVCYTYIKPLINTQTCKYQLALKSVQWQTSCSLWTDRRTDMTKLIVAFRNFSNAPKNQSSIKPKQKLNRGYKKATRVSVGLDGPGFESSQDILLSSKKTCRSVYGPHPASYLRGTGLLSWG